MEVYFDISTASLFRKSSQLQKSLRNGAVCIPVIISYLSVILPFVLLYVHTL